MNTLSKCSVFDFAVRGWIIEQVQLAPPSCVQLCDYHLEVGHDGNIHTVEIGRCCQ